MKYKFAPAFISDFFTPLYDLVIEQGGLRQSNFMVKEIFPRHQGVQFFLAQKI